MLPVFVDSAIKPLSLLMVERRPSLNNRLQSQTPLNITGSTITLYSPSTSQ